MKIPRFESGVEEKLIFRNFREFQSVNLFVSPILRGTSIDKSINDAGLDFRRHGGIGLVVLFRIYD